MPQTTQELVKMAVRIASSLLKVEESDLLKVATVPYQDLTPQQLDWAALIEAIVQAIMTIMNNCPQKSVLFSHVRKPVLFSRVWFQFSAVRPALVSYDITELSPRQVTDAILADASTLDDTIMEVIYAEGTKPNWDVFSDDQPSITS